MKLGNLISITSESSQIHIWSKFIINLVQIFLKFLYSKFLVHILYIRQTAFVWNKVFHAFLCSVNYQSLQCFCWNILTFHLEILIFLLQKCFCHKVALMDFFIWRKSVLFSRYLYFCVFVKSQNLWRHHRRCCIMEVTLLLNRDTSTSSQVSNCNGVVLKICFWITNSSDKRVWTANLLRTN